MGGGTSCADSVEYTRVRGGSSDSVYMLVVGFASRQGDGVDYPQVDRRVRRSGLDPDIICTIGQRREEPQIILALIQDTYVYDAQ